MRFNTKKEILVLYKNLMFILLQKSLFCRVKFPEIKEQEKNDTFSNQILERTLNGALFYYMTKIFFIYYNIKRKKNFI